MHTKWKLTGKFSDKESKTNAYGGDEGSIVFLRGQHEDDEDEEHG
jgi:hypothetical protein